MSNDDQSNDSKFIEHATAALEHAGAAAKEAASETMKGLKKAASWESFGYAVGGAAMVGAATKVAGAVANKVTKKPDEEPEPIGYRRRRYGR